MLRKIMISFGMLGIVALALASSGGDGNKRRGSSIRGAFAPVRLSNGLILRPNPTYAGSQIFRTECDKNFVLYNAVVTYQKGNIIYILPSHYKMHSSTSLFKSNLNVLDLKIRIHK